VIDDWRRYYCGGLLVGDMRGIGPVGGGVLSGGAGVPLAGGITGGFDGGIYGGVPGFTTDPGMIIVPDGTGYASPLPRIGPSVTGTP
jgi:hypothetical protein